MTDLQKFIDCDFCVLSSTYNFDLWFGYGSKIFTCHFGINVDRRVRLRPKIISYCQLSSGWLVFPSLDQLPFNRHLFITILYYRGLITLIRVFSPQLFLFHLKYVCSTTLEFTTHLTNTFIYYFLPFDRHAPDRCCRMMSLKHYWTPLWWQGKVENSLHRRWCKVDNNGVFVHF